MTCSQGKQIHSLEKFPEEAIVTCDDDLIYPKNWMHSIYQEHLKPLESIIGNCKIHFTYDKKRNTLPYKSWK